MLNPEVKAKWVAKLRSGEYPQAKGELRKNEGFCCFGVLCDLYAEETGKGKWEVNAGEHNDGTSFSDWAFISGKNTFQSGFPDDDVMKWAGFSTTPPLAGDSEGLFLTRTTNKAGKRVDLVEHNDTGATFAEIADMIEEQL